MSPKSEGVSYAGRSRRARKRRACAASFFLHAVQGLGVHRLQRPDAAALDRLEAQSAPDEIQVLHDLAAPVDALHHDAREGLPVEARPMAHEPEPVQEDLQNGGNLEGVVRRSENHAVGRLHLLDQQIPVVAQRAELLTPLEADLAAAAHSDVVVPQGDDLAAHADERLQVRLEPGRRVEGGASLVRASNEYGDLHAGIMDRSPFPAHRAFDGFCLIQKRERTRPTCVWRRDRA